MDRRFICDDCGTKWFVPASTQTPADDPDECPACAGRLVKLDDGQPATRP